ncbi:MAG: cytochrome b5 domain-containing protein [Desulfobacterales bacterium]
MKEFNADELSGYNGENGNPVYVAYQGNVYDVSGSKLWRNGMHMRRHHSGKDLTTDIQAAPHEPDVLERYPKVGTLKKEPEERQLPAVIAWLLQKYPMLRRHPHPMTVHFPIAFTFSPPIFIFLYLITGVKSFETTAINCLAAGIIFTIVAIGTGFYAWWLNYLAKPMKALKIKIPLAFVLLILEIFLFVWRINVPDIIKPVGGSGVIYLLIVFSLLPIVTIIGWFGASITFPIEK